MEIQPIPIERAPQAMTLPSEQGLFLAKGSEALNPTIHTKRVDGWAVAPLGLLASPSPALSQDSPIWT